MFDQEIASMLAKTEELHGPQGTKSMLGPHKVTVDVNGAIKERDIVTFLLLVREIASAIFPGKEIGVGWDRDN